MLANYTLLILSDPTFPPVSSRFMRTDMYKRAKKDNIKDNKPGLLADMEYNHKHQTVSGVCLSDSAVSAMVLIILKGRTQ